MGLFSCFGLRTRSYNAKKYELSDNKKDAKIKGRKSTDSIGVADTNVCPQLISETGGEVHTLTTIKDMDECQLNNNHKSDHNNDNKENVENEKPSDDQKCDDCADKPTEVDIKPSDNENTSSGGDHSSDGHQSHTTSDQTPSADVSHSAANTTMDTTSDFSSGADCSGGGMD